MENLKGFEKKYLRGLAHGQKPVVLIGQRGITPSLLAAIHEALDTHELIKIKFNEFKEKDEKAGACEEIQRETGATLVGTIGHMAIFYRPRNDPEKRKIVLPRQASG